MRLQAACEIAQDCGLTTIKEAVLNIKLHAISIFSYDDMADELIELDTEYIKLVELAGTDDILIDTFIDNCDMKYIPYNCDKQCGKDIADNRQCINYSHGMCMDDGEEQGACPV